MLNTDFFVRLGFFNGRKKSHTSPLSLPPLFFLATDEAIYARSAIGLKIMEAKDNNVRSSVERALQADTIRGQIPTGA